MDEAQAALEAGNADEAMRLAYGPDRLIVRQGRVIFWPGTSEVRAVAGDALWARDPWLGQQVTKCSAAKPGEDRAPRLGALSRARVQELRGLLGSSEEVSEPAVEAKVESARDLLDEMTLDELAELDD